MNETAQAIVEHQIRRVRLQLFWQVLAESMLVCLAIALSASTIWFLVRPLAFASFGETLRWSVPGAILGVGLIAGLSLAIWRRPSVLTAALAFDEKFNLKERVTTYLTLPADQIETPVGQALVRDVEATVAKVDVGGAFPITLPWKQILLPIGALTLAVVAFLLDPILSNLRFTLPSTTEQPRAEIDTAKIQEEMEKLKKNVADRKQTSGLQSDELKKMEEEFEKLLNKPLDLKNEEKVKERINEFRKLEEKLKERLDGVREKAQKADALRKQLQQMQLDKEKLKDGPAKNFEDALSRGDLEKAKAALENLAKELKDNKFDAKAQKELAERFKKLQDELKKAVKENELTKKLEKDLKDGKISKEDFAREMENLRQLQDLAQVLGDAHEALGKGDGMEAGKMLSDLAKSFGEMELTDAEVRELLRDQAEIRDALNLLEDGIGDGQGEGDRPGGRRFAGNDPNSKIRNERSRAEVNKKGVQRVTGYAKGGTFSKIPAQAVAGEFQRAAQDAPEAIDRQPIPEDAADIARRYFEKLANPK